VPRIVAACLGLIALIVVPAHAYTVTDTLQENCYDNEVSISCPSAGEEFNGQDAQYATTQPVWSVDADGAVVVDHTTELTWTRGPDITGDGVIDTDDKMTWSEAAAYVDTLNAQGYGGYSDWRLPSIRELYSLYDARGTDISADSTGGIPFIDTDYFNFSYGDTAAGDRDIDMQYISSTIYVATVMNNQECFFGVNFADGRIKCYPTSGAKYAQYVRGNSAYAINDFVDNGDQTISDNGTGLMWQKSDSGYGMIWSDALGYCQYLSHAGHDDWRLPDIKELQSIVDYSRSPETTGTPAIDPVFDSTAITNEAGETDWPYYWSSTTHKTTSTTEPGSKGDYIAFGRGLGYMTLGGSSSWMDVHGAGCQRSEAKTGDPDDYPTGHGPQGDAVRIYNYVRCVRGGV